MCEREREGVRECPGVSESTVLYTYENERERKRACRYVDTQQ